MTLKPRSQSNDSLGLPNANLYRSVKQARIHLLTGKGCSELILNKYAHETFVKKNNLELDFEQL